MLVKKALSLKAIYQFAGQHLIWLIPWMVTVTALYHYSHWTFVIPWLPLSLIGTAVAFFVGFKNNQAYDRLWEARKVWGAIVNNSRMLGTMVKHFRSEDHPDKHNVDSIRKQFIYRHLAYIYQLRTQLLEPAPWEHVSQPWIIGSFNRARHNRIIRAYAEELMAITEQAYLSEEEKKQLRDYKNPATHLLDRQTEVVQQLFQDRHINMMQHVELQRIINSFYEEQGKAERIKRFPFPRQYGSYSFVFVSIFVFLLPFGIVSEFSRLGDTLFWLSVPVGVVVGWVYVVMEMIGDYSENPFEGLSNDIPMLSICRTIEIDLLQMLGEKNIPAAIQAKDDVLI